MVGCIELMCVWVWGLGFTHGHGGRSRHRQVPFNRRQRGLGQTRTRNPAPKQRKSKPEMLLLFFRLLAFFGHSACCLSSLAPIRSGPLWFLCGVALGACLASAHVPDTSPPFPIPSTSAHTHAILLVVDDDSIVMTFPTNRIPFQPQSVKPGVRSTDAAQRRRAARCLLSTCLPLPPLPSPSL